MTSTDATHAVDEAKLEQLMGQVVGFMTGGAMCFAMWLGDELGLYRALAGSGSMTADEIAGKAGGNPRLVREWLHGQGAGGPVSLGPGAHGYQLSTQAAMGP